MRKVDGVVNLLDEDNGAATDRASRALKNWLLLCLLEVFVGFTLLSLSVVSFSDL